MKNIIILFLLIFSTSAFSQKATQKKQVVDVACGFCQFDRTDRKSCTLAVKLNNKIYYVEGTGIDDHGDSHAKDGFCNTVRKAEVIGEVKNGKFVVSYFKLLPLK